MKDTLYYDGLCPLCRKEIALLKRLVANRIVFTDIHQLDSSIDIPSNETLLRRLHLKRADGNWLIGLDANVYIWSHTRYGVLLKPLRWPLIRILTDSIYNLWADKRYRKLYACHIAQSKS